MKQLLIIPLLILLAATCEDKPCPECPVCDTVTCDTTIIHDSINWINQYDTITIYDTVWTSDTSVVIVIEDSLIVTIRDSVIIKDSIILYHIIDTIWINCPVDTIYVPGICPDCPCDTTCPEEPTGETKYLATFESGITADLGGRSSDIRNGATLTVVDNPYKNNYNNTNKVLRVYAPEHTSGERQRAEYQSQTVPITERTFVYKWSAYYPAGAFRGVTYASTPGAMCNQFKAYPCAEGEHPDEVCESGGIFNDLHIGETAWIRLRANPDCRTVEWNYTEGSWNNYQFEIYYTKTNRGYARFWINGVLIEEHTGIKTLFDSYSEAACNGGMFWANGLYCSFTGKSDITYYLDNIELIEK